MDDALTIVSLLANLVLLYLLFLAHQGRRYFRGMRGDREEKFFVGESDMVRPAFRRYVLKRNVDVSGVSGTGVVCEIAEFSDGHAALHWIDSEYPWTTPCPEGIDAIQSIHGHGVKSKVVPID